MKRAEAPVRPTSRDVLALELIAQLRDFADRLERDPSVLLQASRHEASDSIRIVLTVRK